MQAMDKHVSWPFNKVVLLLIMIKMTASVLPNLTQPMMPFPSAHY